MDLPASTHVKNKPNMSTKGCILNNHCLSFKYWFMRKECKRRISKPNCWKATVASFVHLWDASVFVAQLTGNLLFKWAKLPWFHSGNGWVIINFVALYIWINGIIELKFYVGRKTRRSSGRHDGTTSWSRWGQLTSSGSGSFWILGGFDYRYSYKIISETISRAT